MHGDWRACVCINVSRRACYIPAVYVLWNENNNNNNSAGASEQWEKRGTECMSQQEAFN